MSDSIQHQLFVADEDVYGEISTNEYQVVRHGGCTLKLTRSAHASPELRTDRNLADHRLGVHKVDGDITMEMLYEPDSAFGLLLQSLAIGNVPTTPAAVTSSLISCASGDNSINISSGSLPVVKAGDTILIAGVVGPTGNNGLATVVSRTASKIVISGRTLTADIAGDSITITPLTKIYTFDGSSRDIPSLTFVRDFGDDQGGVRYQTFTGCNVSSMNVKSPADGNVAVSFTIMGQNMVANSDGLAGLADSPSTVRPMDSYTGSLTADGNTANITEIDLTIANNLADRFVVGSKLTQNHTIGQRGISGSFTAFFDSVDWMAKFTDETNFAITHTIKDPAGNSISFELPKVYITAAAADTQGTTGEIVLSLPYVAVYDATAGYAVEIRTNPAIA